MAEKHQPAVDLARAYVLRCVAEGLWKQGQRLPPLRRLAVDAGVSVPTMAKTLRDMREQAGLHICPRRGITVGPVQKTPAPSLPADAAERVFLDIQRDIRIGRYHPSLPLPSCKELGSTYGICFATLKSALSRLVDNGILFRHKKHYFARRSPVRRGGSSLLLIMSEGLFQFVEMYEKVRTSILPFVQTLERECTQRNLRLIIRPFRGDLDILAGLPDLVGVVVMFEPHFPPQDRANALARSLLTLKCPVYLADGKAPDYYGDLPPSENLYGPVDSTFSSGSDMGQFLLSQGHRRVCFFAHEPGLYWSEGRLSGMRKAFDTAGLPDAVTGLVAATPDRRPGVEVDPAENNPTVTPEMRRHATHIKQQVAYLEREFGPSPFRRRVVGEMKEMLVDLSGVWTRFLPLCEQALALDGVTAWVAAEDQIAVYAMYPFLASKRLRVPRDISIAGFNNIPESIAAGLTTYDYNTTGEVLTVMDLFLFPERRKYYINTKINTVAVSSYIVDRGSVAKV